MLLSVARLPFIRIPVRAVHGLWAQLTMHFEQSLMDAVDPFPNAQLCRERLSGHNTFKPSSLASIGVRACPFKSVTIQYNVFEKNWDGDIGFERCSSLSGITMDHNMIGGVVDNTVAVWHERLDLG